MEVFPTDITIEIGIFPILMPVMVISKLKVAKFGSAHVFRTKEIRKKFMIALLLRTKGIY